MVDATTSSTPAVSISRTTPPTVVTTENDSGQTSSLPPNTPVVPLEDELAQTSTTMASSSALKSHNVTDQVLLDGKGGPSNAHVSTGDIDDFSYGTSVATCSPAVRLGFIRKVYGILAAQLLLTTVVCAAFMFIPPLRSIATAASGLLQIVSFIGTLGTLLALLAYKDNHPLNLQLLAGFTLFESFLVGSICAIYAASGLSYLVLEALVITFSIFAGITIYAFVSKRDFSFLGGALFAALLALFACSFINVILGVTGNKSPALAFLISWGGSVLFSLYILYDTSMIIHHLGPDDAIMGAISLYLDILNLFLHILSILSRSRD